AIISPSGSFNAIVRAPLPARLQKAGNQALGAEIPERNAAELVLAIEGARAAGHFAAVAHPRRRRVARQFGELQRGRETFLDRPLAVARNRLEPDAPAGKFL